MMVYLISIDIAVGTSDMIYNILSVYYVYILNVYHAYIRIVYVHQIYA